MKVLLQKCLAIAAMFGFAYQLLDAFQYRNAATALGTLTHVGERICLASNIFCDHTAVKVAYKDGEIDREVDVKYVSHLPRYRPRAPQAAVGVQTEVVYVAGRPWLTRHAIDHLPGWGRVLLAAIFALFAWIAWRGDEHPLLVWLNTRRGWPNDS
jgi:hypothetical protein